MAVRVCFVGVALVLHVGTLAGAEPPYRTPRAGERVTAALFGKTVVAEARDRGRITYLNLGAIALPGGPDGLSFGPAGGLYLWRVPPDERSRLRAVLAGIANELRWDRRLRDDGPLSAVLTFDSLTLPWARSEYVQGERLRAEELEWHQVRAGAGAAWRTRLAPGAVDNGLDLALTAETGGLWFANGSRTAPGYVTPPSAWETRLHLRGRADTLERNLLELPHQGWSAGVDLVAAWRAGWEPWGDAGAGLETGGGSWQAASGFAFWVPGLPGLSERHRVIASVHAGAGAGLDRFSAFRLGSGSTWGDFETLSRAVLPAAGVDEIATSRYAIADLEYRFEALFFLYVQIRGTLAVADRPVSSGGRVRKRTGSFPALTVGVTSGLPFRLAAEISASYNFGLETPGDDGRREKGRAGFLVSITREF